MVIKKPIWIQVRKILTGKYQTSINGFDTRLTNAENELTSFLKVKKQQRE